MTIHASRPVVAASGSVAAPSYSYVEDPASGFYLYSSGVVGLAILGGRAGFVTEAPAVTTNGRGNTFLGHHAGEVNNLNTGTTGGYNNTAIGGESGVKNTTGNQNTYVGSRSGHEAVTANQNTFVGQGAGYENTASGNVGMGFHAALNSQGSLAMTAIGTQAGEGTPGTYSADNNTFVGYQAGKGVTSGAGNTVMGATAGTSLTSGGLNTLIGYQAGRLLQTGSGNVCVGREAGEALVGVSDATMVGKLAGNISTVGQCTFVGSGAGIVHTSGPRNTFLGFQAGYTATPANATTTGGDNTFVGHNAGAGVASQVSNAVAIGSGVTVPGSGYNQVGIPASTTIHPGGQISKRTARGAGAYSILATDYIIGKTAITGGGDTLTLPSVTSVDAGRTIIVKDESGAANGTDSITVVGSGGATIDGGASAAITTAYGILRLYCDGTNWFTI